MEKKEESMLDEKKSCFSKAVIILLLINTFLLGGILFKMSCPLGQGGFCFFKRGSKVTCPLSQKGSQKGSGTVDMQQKGSDYYLKVTLVVYLIQVR